MHLWVIFKETLVFSGEFDYFKVSIVNTGSVLQISGMQGFIVWFTLNVTGDSLYIFSISFFAITLCNY